MGVRGGVVSKADHKAPPAIPQNVPEAHKGAQESGIWGMCMGIGAAYKMSSVPALVED